MYMKGFESSLTHDKNGMKYFLLTLDLDAGGQA